jgi:hypothetical protein
MLSTNENYEHKQNIKQNTLMLNIFCQLLYLYLVVINYLLNKDERGKM